ncbi:MAG TPA: hypothetical protein VMW65_15245, partial [Chloroflexota bacterium]|nr:hypothetical protein [Chloroflexota bacterium]
HRVLLEYYDTTVDVLDQRKTDQKVWETAFLTALFEVLDRPCLRREDTITYHLDYKEDVNWIDEERTVIARSRMVARTLVERVQTQSVGTVPLVPRTATLASPPALARWADWARRTLHLGS